MVYDTISRQSKWEPDADMAIFGYLIFIVMLPLVVPLLPFALIIWLASQFRSPRGEPS